MERNPSIRFSYFSVLLAVLLTAMLCVPGPVAAADDDKSPASSSGDAQAGQKQEEAAVPSADKVLQDFLESQRTQVAEALQTAKEQSSSFMDTVAGLGQKLRPYEDEYHRLVVWQNSIDNWPLGLESISRSIAANSAKVRRLMDSAQEARDQAQAALDRVNKIDNSLPDALKSNVSRLVPDFKSMLKDITLAQTRLTALLKRYDSAMAPAQTLLDNMQKDAERIAAQLPESWKQYYLHGPEPYLSAKAWTGALNMLSVIPQIIAIRLPVEIPTTPDEWQTAALRGLLMLAISSLLSIMLYRRIGHGSEHPVIRHIFRVSIIWICLGFALGGASLSVDNEFYRVFLALGNMSLILGQMCLAWDLRQLQHPSAPRVASPLWHLMPLTLCAYSLIYLPLPRVVALSLWLLALALRIISRRFRYRRTAASSESVEVSADGTSTSSSGSVPEMEQSIMKGAGILLWICVAMTLCGLHIYSMALYLLYSSCALALQLSVASMALCSRLNDNLPKEGGSAAFASILLALAAPCILVLALAAVSLWLCTLPGGVVLLSHYVLQGVNVGATQFNMLQVLLIISAFFITRTFVRMGTLFLQRLPRRVQIDVTLIPPLQTSLTYASWALFGLFVLRSLGMELSNLAVVAGGLSVGIGFGMQTIVNNFVSGLLLIFSRSMQVGDVVEVGGTVGRVRKISVRATVVETYDNASIYVPNSEFVSGRLTNWTRSSRTTRRDVVVGVAYGSDTALVMKLLLNAANATDNILKYPTPVVLFSDFGASTLDFTLRFWVQDYDLAVSTSSNVRLAIERLLREHNIEVAFPQMDVHIKEMPPRALTPRDLARRASSPAPVAQSKPASADGKPAQSAPRRKPLRVRRRFCAPQTTGTAGAAGTGETGEA